VTAFDAAMAALIADPHLAVEAIYRAGGTGDPVPLRVFRSAPDQLRDAFGTTLIQATDALTVAVAVLPTIEPGDVFTLGADILTVQHAERDAANVAWRVLCQR
jgi:hypothetical protein